MEVVVEQVDREEQGHIHTQQAAVQVATLVMVVLVAGLLILTGQQVLVEQAVVGMALALLMALLAVGVV
jgi:hypothetical protein